jgi:WD40 repeat protein
LQQASSPRSLPKVVGTLQLTSLNEKADSKFSIPQPNVKSEPQGLCSIAIGADKNSPAVAICSDLISLIRPDDRSHAVPVKAYTKGHITGLAVGKLRNGKDVFITSEITNQGGAPSSVLEIFAIDGGEPLCSDDFSGRIMALAFDNNHLAVGTSESELRLYSNKVNFCNSKSTMIRGRDMHYEGQGPPISALAFDRDSRRIAVGTSELTVVIDLHTGSPIIWTREQKPVTFLAFDKSEIPRYLATADEQGSVKIVDLDPHAALYQGLNLPEDDVPIEYSLPHDDLSNIAILALSFKESKEGPVLNLFTVGNVPHTLNGSQSYMEPAVLVTSYDLNIEIDELCTHLTRLINSADLEVALTGVKDKLSEVSKNCSDKVAERRQLPPGILRPAWK